MQWPEPHKTIRLRDGGIGTYHGVCPITGKHRVNYRDTIWLLDNDGFARADRQPSPQDYTGE